MRIPHGSNAIFDDSLLLHDILRSNKTLYTIIKKSAKINLTDYYIAAGCIAQTVWNYQDGNDLMLGIDDWQTYKRFVSGTERLFCL